MVAPARPSSRARQLEAPQPYAQQPEARLHELRAPARVALRAAAAPRRVAKREVVSRRRAALALLMAVLVVGALFSVVVAHVVLTQNQFRLDDLEARAASEEATQQRLRLEVAQLQSPSRIVQVAQQRLGMVVPSNVTYLEPVPTSTAAGPARSPNGSRAADVPATRGVPPAAGSRDAGGSGGSPHGAARGSASR
jgi:cell division protein FtsL